MSKLNNKEYIVLIWQDPKSRRNFRVAQLVKNGMYEFEYAFEVKEAKEKGFQLLMSFPEENKKYTSNRLFQVFASRLPDKKRKDIDSILLKYGMEEYDEFELLKRSEGQLPIDNLRFVDPIFDDDVPIDRRIWLAGARYYLPCEGVNCEEIHSVFGGNAVMLEDPDNPKDENALKVVSQGAVLGYIPRYYNGEIMRRLRNGSTFECKELRIMREHNCRECVSVRLVEFVQDS